MSRATRPEPVGARKKVLLVHELQNHDNRPLTHLHIGATAGLQRLLSTLQGRCCHRHMQDSLPAGWLAFTGWELNPLVRNERFPSCYISSSVPGFILTLDGPGAD